MFFLTLPKISVCILINYVPSSSTVPITRTLCHQLTVNGGIRLLQDIQWKKNWAEPSCWKHLLRSATRKGQLCHPIQTPWRSFYPDSFFATVFWALGCVQSGPLPAQNRLGKAWPRTAIHTPQAGREHTQNIHTIRNGSSSKKHPNTTPGTGVKSGSTSGLLWSASPDTVVSSSHSGEGWQLQWKQVKKNTPCSQAEKYLGQFIHYKHQQELRDLQIVHDFQGFRPCLLGNEILFSSASLLKPICYCKAELDTYMIAISQ